MTYTGLRTGLVSPFYLEIPVQPPEAPRIFNFQKAYAVGVLFFLNFHL